MTGVVHLVTKMWVYLRSSGADLPVSAGSDVMKAANIRGENRVMENWQFAIIIEHHPEGEYLVSVPALPGCYTEENARRGPSDGG
jgi:hypothetical protein